MDWQPIDTLPEKTWALLYIEYPVSKDGPLFIVDCFEWEERKVHDDMAPIKDGDATIERVRVRVVRERAWQEGGWAATHWAPLPPPPSGS